MIQTQVQTTRTRVRTIRTRVQIVPTAVMLYVLKNDKMLRVSVGGPDKQEAKLQKCKALAQKALSRL